MNNHVGIAVLMNGKIKFAIECTYTEDQEHLSPIVKHGPVTFGSYKRLTSLLTSILTKLNIKDLIAFMEFCNPSEKKNFTDCCTSVPELICVLHSKLGKVCNGMMKDSSCELDKVIKTKDKKHVRKINEKFLNENCEIADVGFYQKYAFDFGFVIKCNAKNKLCHEFRSLKKSNKESSKAVTNQKVKMA